MGKRRDARRVIRRIASPEKTGTRQSDLRLPDTRYGREVGTNSKLRKGKYSIAEGGRGRSSVGFGARALL